MRACRRSSAAWLAVALSSAGVACRAAAPRALERFPAGHAIVVCGARVPIDAPVVLWTMEPRYDAYAEGPRFAPEGASGKRYKPGRDARTPELAAAVERDGWTLEHLREQLDLFVLHYDACGTSQTCFRVLQDERQLSVHFLLDVDGTIYQTLDLRDQAWHARSANPRSIGVEIAHVGAFQALAASRLERWYEWTEEGTRLVLPSSVAGSPRCAFDARPAREGLLRGPIHGAQLVQYDFTAAQYRSLGALSATLARLFPQITLDAPRDAAGHVRSDALSDEEKAAVPGVLGHFHLQTDKQDPGPAFDWERLLAEARARAAAP